MKKLIPLFVAMFVGVSFSGLAVAGDDPVAAGCKKQAEEKKLAGADADKFVKECVEKAGKK